MEEHQNVQMSTWHLLSCNRFLLCTGNSFSASTLCPSSSMIDTVSTSVQSLVLHTGGKRRCFFRLRAPAHRYHARPTSAHLFLRAPLVTSQVTSMPTRSPRRSRSSHSLSSYSAATSRLLLFSRLSHQCPFHFWTLAVQTTPPCDAFQDVSTQTSDQQDTLSCDMAVQTSFHSVHTSSLDAAVQTIPHSTLSQNVSGSSLSIDVAVQTSFHGAHILSLDAAAQTTSPITLVSARFYADGFSLSFLVLC